MYIYIKILLFSSKKPLKTVLLENACLLNEKEEILDQLKNNHLGKEQGKNLIWARGWTSPLEVRRNRVNTPLSLALDVLLPRAVAKRQFLVQRGEK
jgi:hypothetical protein